MSDREVPVLIVGGGGTGLTASMLLPKLGVESPLVTAWPDTSFCRTHMYSAQRRAAPPLGSCTPIVPGDRESRHPDDGIANRTESHHQPSTSQRGCNANWHA
jgi:hypothetical protein